MLDPEENRKEEETEQQYSEAITLMKPASAQYDSVAIYKASSNIANAGNKVGKFRIVLLPFFIGQGPVTQIEGFPKSS